MSGYFNELVLSIEAMLSGDAPAVQAGIADELSEPEEIRRRAYAATVAAWSSPAAEPGAGNAPATRSAGRSAGRGRAAQKLRRRRGRPSLRKRKRPLEP